MWTPIFFGWLSIPGENPDTSLVYLWNREWENVDIHVLGVFVDAALEFSVSEAADIQPKIQ